MKIRNCLQLMLHGRDSAEWLILGGSLVAIYAMSLAGWL